MYTGLATFFTFVFILSQIVAAAIEGGGLASTQLTVAIDDTSNTLSVVSTVGFLGADSGHPAFIQIGDEVVSYTGRTDTTFTGVVRGLADPQSRRATTAVSHTAGTKVQTLSIATLDSMMGYNITTSGADFGFLDAIKLLGRFFENLPKMLAWDYPWLTGQATILRLPLFALSAGFIFGVAMLMLGLAQSIWRS